ncbi:MAG TPA: GNAT family N-acetyltransferase [Niastella sp.]|nr:GNAT family N-acetyltransferase [Niastella sp.]
MNNVIIPLYASLMPSNKSGVVHEQSCSHGKLTVALRPLSLPGDWHFVSKCMSRIMARSATHPFRLPDKYLQETYSTMLLCDFAQPYIGLLNNTPGFLIEICDGEKQLAEYETGFYVLEKGDHMINIITSPTVINSRNKFMNALNSSLQYFFLHPQVNNIAWILHEREKHFIKLANQLGFAVSNRYNRSGVQVFLYSREKFRRFSDSLPQQTKKLV